VSQAAGSCMSFSSCSGPGSGSAFSSRVAWSVPEGSLLEPTVGSPVAGSCGRDFVGCPCRRSPDCTVSIPKALPLSDLKHLSDGLASRGRRTRAARPGDKRQNVSCCPSDQPGSALVGPGAHAPWMEHGPITGINSTDICWFCGCSVFVTVM
jgi:hypothetical protein